MIPKRFRPFDPSKGPWLIWSYYHSAWHRRSETGHAAGYTTDIAHAGIFDEATARAYHERGLRAHRRNVSIPARKAATALQHRVAELAAEQVCVRQTIAGLANWISSAPSERASGQTPGGHPKADPKTEPKSKGLTS